MEINFWNGSWKGVLPNGVAHTRAREIVRSTGAIVRGKFPSRKTGRMVHHEGLLELDAIYLFETMAQIGSYTEQPETITYPDGNRVRRYTPDFELKLTSGERVLIEVKPLVYAEKPEMQHKLGRITEHFGRMGQRYLVLTDAFLRTEPRLRNLKWIYGQAPRRVVTEMHSDLSLKKVGHLFPMTIRAALVLLAPLGENPFALLCRGTLQCDLNSVLSLDSTVDVSKDRHHGSLRI